MEYIEALENDNHTSINYILAYIDNLGFELTRTESKNRVAIRKILLKIKVLSQILTDLDKISEKIVAYDLVLEKDHSHSLL